MIFATISKQKIDIQNYSADPSNRMCEWLFNPFCSIISIRAEPTCLWKWPPFPIMKIYKYHLVLNNTGHFHLPKTEMSFQIGQVII